MTPTLSKSRILICAMAAGLLAFGLPDAIRGQDAATSTDCNAGTLNEANGNFDIGLFERVVYDLKPCVPDGLDDKDQRIGAYRLLALSYIATDSLDQAQESVRQLLKTDSGYKADPATDPPLFAEMIQAEQPPWYTFMWEGSSAGRWAGRVAVVGTAVAVPLLLRDTSDPPLPGPPDLPSGAGQ